jgi:hypothetical protein
MKKHIHLSVESHKILKIAAVRVGRLMADVAEEAIAEWLVRHEGDAPSTAPLSRGGTGGGRPRDPAIRARVLAAVSSCAGQTRRAGALAAGVSPTTFNAHFAALEREGAVSLAEGRVSVTGVVGGSS